MIEDKFSRTGMIFGSEAMKKLNNARVAVFGAGGVGGYVIEALARSGVGALDIIDNDVISITNFNRQILDVESTLGMKKTESASKRIADINPECKVTTYDLFFLPETKDEIGFSCYDYVVDAIDTVTGKLQIIKCAEEAGVPVISSMGTGNKTDPSALEITDIFKTSVCPLAKVMRKLCRENGIDRLKVLYSKEIPVKTAAGGDDGVEKHAQGRPVPGSVSFVPPAAGLMIAGEVIKDITGYKK